MSEIKRLLNALLWEIYGRIPAANFRRQRKSELMSMHPKLYEPRLLARLHAKVLDDICAILQLEIRLMSKYLERVLISRDKNRTQQTILYGFLGVIVSSRLGESSREMRFTLSPPPGAAKGRGDSTRTGTVEETTSPSDFSQWLHAMKMVARLPGGMPPEFRRKLWLALAEKYLKAKNVDWMKEEEKCFSEQWREDDEELGIQIVKDLHRTGSSLCSGPAGTINQAKLKRILLGYARYNPEVGYCQGFNMLGALILQVMDKEEIESIKVMIYLVEGILPKGYFSGSLGGLQADMAVFRELMTSKLPRLAKHLQKLQGPMENAFEPPLTNVFTMQWFLTMFCTCLPMTCVLRVWDLVLIEGSDVLLRTALVLWSLLEERILSAKTADDFYCKMGSFSSELLNGHLIDSNGLIEKVVELGPVPDLQKMRDKHLYNISPFRDQKGLQLYYSDEDGDSDEDSQMAVATAWGLRLSRRGSAGLSNKTDGKERIALDISLLKKQYDRLRERQRQAHIILTSAVARQGSNPNQSSIQMNQLLIGRNAIVTNNGRRLGPPQGAIPPARKPSLPTSVKSSKLVQSKPQRRGETLHWRDTELSKRRRGSVKWKDIKPSGQQTSQDERTPQLVDSAPSSRSSSSEPKSQRNSFKTHQRSDSSSYSEDSDGNSSTSTSLCDEDDHEVGDKNASSLEASPLKKSKSSKKHAEGSHKKSLDDILSSNEKQHTTQIPFVQLTTMGSPLRSANKTELHSLEYAKEDSENESNRLEYAGFVDEYSWPDITEPAKSAPLEDLMIDVTEHDTDYLSLPTTITSISQLSPIADISTYIKSSSISPLRTPISAFDYSNLVGSTDDPKDFNVNDEGVTNEYFERVNIVERPTKLDLLYSLNEEDSIRNAFKSCEASPEESTTKETSNLKVTLERNKEQSNEMTTHPLTEEVDRKMKVLLEYSNQSSLSFIAEAKHEISSGLFKDKEFESNSLKTLSVPYARRKEPVEETADIILPLPKVEFKVKDKDLWSGKDSAKGDACKRVEVPQQIATSSDELQIVLAPKSIPPKPEPKVSTVCGEDFSSEIRSELRQSFIGEKAGAFSQKTRDLPADSAPGFASSDGLHSVLAPENIPLKTELRVSTVSGEVFGSKLRKSLAEEDADAFSQKKPDLETESGSRSLHIPTTENLETRFNALELTFVDRVDSLKDAKQPKKGDAVKDVSQRPQGPDDKSPFRPSATELGVATRELHAPGDRGAKSQNLSNVQLRGEDTTKNFDNLLPETADSIENSSNKTRGIFMEPDLEDKPASSDYKPRFLTGQDHSEEKISDANAKVAVFNTEEYQSFGRDGSSGIAAHDLSVHDAQKGAPDEEKYVPVSVFTEHKGSHVSEKDSNDLIGTESAHGAYSFLPTPDVQTTTAVLPESILTTSSILGKQIVEKEAGDQVMRAESEKETLESRPSDQRESKVNLEKVPILLATKPVYDFREDTSENPENSSSNSEKLSGGEKPDDMFGISRKQIIPSTEDLESRFMALERQFSEKSISVDPTASTLKSPIKEKSAAGNVQEVSVKTTIEISVTENIPPSAEDEAYVRSDNHKKSIPTTAALEERFEQLERKLSEHTLIASNTSSAEVSNKRKAVSDNESQAPKSPSEKLSEPPYVRKRIPSTEDLENRFKALEIQKAMKSPTAATTSLLSPLGSSVALPFTKTATDDSTNVPSTEALESRFKALDTSKPLESTLRDEAKNLSLTSDSGIPSTRDLENRFEALEQQKKDDERKHKVREMKNQELNSDSKPTPYSGLKEELPIAASTAVSRGVHALNGGNDGAGEVALKLGEIVEQCKQETKKLPSTHDLELRFDALQGSSNSLELKSSKDIMNENKKHSKHIPSTQDLETRFKILEGSKPQPLDDNHVKITKADESTSKRPLSQQFEVDAICNVSRPLDDQVSKAKDLRVMKYDPNARIDRNQKEEASVNNDVTPTNCSEITISFKRKDLYKVESQSDETLTATDPTSTEFDTKIESRPTSCPEYNDALYSNTVNTDRVLKIIEENSKILHRILKKTLADAGSLETSTQHKIIHPGITDSLLALGNIFPRSDETVTPSGGDGTKSRSPYRSCITLHSDDNISDRLASIKSTIKSIDTLCEEKSFRKDKCQKYIDSLFAHSKISTAIPLNPSIRVEDFEASTPQSRITKRELKKDISPRRRRDEEREEYESRVRRDMMPNSLDPSSELSCSLASFDVDKEVDRIDQEKTTQRPVSPYHGSGYELNKRSVTPVVYIPTKLEIRHTTVTSTFYDRYLTEKEIEKTFPKSRKSPVSPTVTKSYLDISKYSSTNVNDRNSKSAENSPSRRKDAADLFLYEKSPPASKQHNLTSNLSVGQKDLHIQSCDNILLRLQSTTHHRDMDKPLLVYNALQKQPPDLGISRGIYKDYGSDESTKS